MANRKHKQPDADDSARDSKRKRSSSTAPSDTTLESSNTPPASVADDMATNQPVVIGTTQGTPVTQHDLNFTPAELEMISDEFMLRVLAILNFADTRANRFAIGLMPSDVAWGPAGDGNGLDKYLCRDGRPLALWMLGLGTSVWLTPVEGSRVSMGLRLLCARDQDVARRIQYERCEPRGEPDKAGMTTYSNRFLSAKGEDIPSAFEEVYDASEILGPWSTMDKIPHDRVHKTDIVLVECYVRRFKGRDNNNRYTWKNWGVSFELLRIAHLLQGPGPAALVPEESTVNL